MTHAEIVADRPRVVAASQAQGDQIGVPCGCNFVARDWTGRVRYGSRDADGVTSFKGVIVPGTMTLLGKPYTSAWTEGAVPGQIVGQIIGGLPLIKCDRGVSVDGVIYASHDAAAMAQ